MSLSQSHPGKVFVPWRNKSEWLEVKELIYSDELMSQKRALESLRCWKLRTPLLPIGVEGTFIILEAILVDKDLLKESELQNIYATAVLRYLNICISNERQGRFSRNAKKSELPKWVVTLRHDIAHDFKLPSLFNLELALKEGLKFVKSKYWDIYGDQMEPLVNSNVGRLIAIICCYAELNLLMFYQKGSQKYIDKMNEYLKYIFPDQYQNPNRNVKSFFKVVKDQLYEDVSDHELKNVATFFMASLVDKGTILSTSHEMDKGKPRIPIAFLNIWQDLINLFYKSGIIYVFLKKLVYFLKGDQKSELKLVASLWIVEIYRTFLKIKAVKQQFELIKQSHMEHLDTRTGAVVISALVEQNDEFKNTLNFQDIQHLPGEESQLFEELILKEPTEFTLNYLKPVLLYNNKSVEEIAVLENNIKMIVNFNSTTAIKEDIATFCCFLDLPIQNQLNFENDCITLESPNPLRRRFRRVKDPSKYAGLPLGVSPLSGM